MHKQSLVIIVLYLFCKISAKIHDKFHGKHSFPRYTPDGNEAANEFQMIQPENIVDKRYKRAAVTHIIIKVSPTLIKNDDIVTITFQSSSPSTSDWIGAYSPANVNISETVPIKYGYCDDSASYLSTGVGELTFNLTNLRSDVGFYYFTNGLSKPMLVDISTDVVSFENINEPLRPRVVATGDNDILNLLWSSATSSKPVLKWGTQSGVYDHTFAASTSTIEKSSVCGSPANTVGWRELGLIHTASFIGMKALADQRVYYTFGDAATNNLSEEFVLFVPPIPGMTSSTTTSDGKLRPTRAILYDDLGRGSTDMSYTWNEYGRPSVNTMYAVGAEVMAGNVDVVYHGGDISYATGYLAVWDFFLDMISPVARSVVYLSTVGNHESDWYESASYFSNGDSGGECGVLTTTLLPQPQPASLNKPWWSYEVGMFHFIGISTEHNFTTDSEQYLWLVKDLKSIDRDITPWVIFGGHRAMYLNSDYGGSVTADIDVMDLMIQHLEPLLYEYQVNLGFYGHNHVVQRQTAVLNKTVIQASTTVIDEETGHVYHLHNNPQATVHMVVGTGGAGFTKNAYSDKPQWNELYYYQWGYAKLTAVNASYLDWEWVDSQTGETVDRMVITQKYPIVPWK